MEGISTLLSTGFALTSKMVGANVILLSANMSKVFLLLCIVWTFIRGVARRFLSSNARGEPEEQAQVSGSCSSANCRCDSQSTTEYPQRNQGMFKQIQTDFVTCLSSCGVGVSFGVCQAEDEAAAVKNWILKYAEQSSDEDEEDEDEEKLAHNPELNEKFDPVRSCNNKADMNV